jgi:phage terminase large subunit-like protein
VEINQGGAMVETVMRAERAGLPLRPVRASRGKTVRAEPIAALYEQGRVAHAGAFPALEDQLVLFTPFGIEGDGAADRADALVWALWDLFPRMVKPQAKADWDDGRGGGGTNGWLGG